VTADAVRQHREQDGRAVRLFGVEGGHGITVLVVLARHALVGMCLDVQVRA
jgi:hypothetical protein